MRNPFIGVPPFVLSCDWACHRGAGYQGGVDYATGRTSGLEVRSALSGRVLAVSWNIDGAGSSWLAIGSSELSSVYMHLKRIDVTINDVVREGQVVGLSGGALGDPGRGVATGPHVHWHLQAPAASSTVATLGPAHTNNGRMDPLAYLTAYQSPPPVTAWTSFWDSLRSHPGAPRPR